MLFRIDASTLPIRLAIFCGGKSNPGTDRHNNCKQWFPLSFSTDVPIHIPNYKFDDAQLTANSPLLYISVVTLGILTTSLFAGFHPALTITYLRALGVPGAIGAFLLSSFLMHTLFTYQQHKRHADFPQPPRDSFFDGNWPTLKAAQSKNQLFDKFGEWVDTYGQTILFWRQYSPKYFTADPDIVRSMLTEISIFTKFKFIPNRSLFGQRMTGTSSFLTVVGGSQWAIKRKVMSPYFSKIHLTTMFDKCHDYIKRGLELQFEEVEMNKTNVDIVEYYGELYQFFLGALGFDLDCELVSKNAKFHNAAIQGILKWAPRQFGSIRDLLKMRVDKSVNNTICYLNKLRNISREIIAVKMEEYNTKGPQPDDIIHHVITANQLYDEPGVTNADLIIYMTDDIVTIFLVIDNMVKTLANMLVRVMREPRVYKKMVEEIRDANLISLQSMDKSLRYTEMIILETLRLHPTLMRGIRYTENENTELNNGLVIKDKGMIFFGQLVLHRSTKYWKDPYEFQPERWENGSKDITPFTYLPFVAGPRVCMGKHLAIPTT